MTAESNVLSVRPKRKAPGKTSEKRNFTNNGDFTSFPDHGDPG